jgi:diadenosine tetraphosphatase ApaH/serine/threonine PP2A family protein phosphatase
VSTRPLCLFGHTHYPVTFQLSAEAFDSVGPSGASESVVRMLNGAKYLVNPGSVGQPRDGDPRAAYAIVDVDERCVELVRLKYPVEVTQGKIVAAGLPEVLAQRLALGR